MAKRSRIKGKRIERDFVNRLKSLGIESARVPNSGNSPYSMFKGDVIVNIEGKIYVFELKGRKRLVSPFNNLKDIIQIDKYIAIPFNLLLEKNEEDIKKEIEKQKKRIVMPKTVQQWIDQSKRENAFLVIKENYRDFIFIIEKKDLSLILSIIKKKHNSGGENN